MNYECVFSLDPTAVKQIGTSLAAFKQRDASWKRSSERRTLKRLGLAITAIKGQGQKSRSFEGESLAESFGEQDIQESGVSQQIWSNSRSHSVSPTPCGSEQEEFQRKISGGGDGQIARLPKSLDLREHKRARALTLKTVAEAVLGFVRQERILRLAVGAFSLKQGPMKYDLKRLKNYVKTKQSFTSGLSRKRDIEITAPDAAKKKSTMKAFANAVSQAKALSKKKGGFLKPKSPVETKESNGTPPAGQSATPLKNIQDGHQDAKNITASYGAEFDRRFPPGYGPGPGFFDRPPWAWGFPGPTGGPHGMGPRDEFEYYQWRDAMMHYGGRGYWDEHPRRELESDRYFDPRSARDLHYRDFDPSEKPWGRRGDEDHQDAMEDYQEEYKNTPHGERYKLAPPEFRRHRKDSRSPERDRGRYRSSSPADDKYLRFQDSSPEDQHRGTGREDYGYYSGPSGPPESKGSRRNTKEQLRRQEKGSDSHRPKLHAKDSRSRSRSNEKRFKHRNRSIANRGYEVEIDDDSETPEEYKWAKRGLYPVDNRNNFSRRGRGYNNSSQWKADPKEEMAKLQSIAVYAAAMGGVNDVRGLSLLLSWIHRLSHFTAA